MLGWNYVAVRQNSMSRSTYVGRSSVVLMITKVSMTGILVKRDVTSKLTQGTKDIIPRYVSQKHKLNNTQIYFRLTRPSSGVQC